jgi:MFS family permease
VDVRRRGLFGLLGAQAVSLVGTRVSMIALPWFVLVTTGSAARTGLVLFCEMTPYVVAKALGGPLVDRTGPRRVSVVADVLSAVLVGAIPLAHAVGVLRFWVLLLLVAAVGLARGPGDSAKTTLVPDVAGAARVPMERVTGSSQTIERLASTIGPMAGGFLIAATGPLTALVVDAVSFGLAAVIIAGTAPGWHEPEAVEGYLRRLRTGLDFLRRDGLLPLIAIMVSVTNLLDAALIGVLVPVWARETGAGPAAIGLLATALSAPAILGSTVATVIAHRLPRRLAYLVSFLVAGAPRFVVLALAVPLWAAIAVWAVAGLGAGFINPILGAVIIERIPRPLLGRVSALAGSLAWAGIPLGGLVGGGLVVGVGLAPALLLCGAAYLAVTLLPAVRPAFREMDNRRPAGGHVPAEHIPADVRVPGRDDHGSARRSPRS